MAFLLPLGVQIKKGIFFRVRKNFSVPIFFIKKTLYNNVLGLRAYSFFLARTDMEGLGINSVSFASHRTKLFGTGLSSRLFRLWYLYISLFKAYVVAKVLPRHCLKLEKKHHYDTVLGAKFHGVALERSCCHGLGQYKLFGMICDTF